MNTHHECRFITKRLVVVVITRALGTEWLGNIRRDEQYRSLLDWAVRYKDAATMLALPPGLAVAGPVLFVQNVPGRVNSAGRPNPERGV